MYPADNTTNTWAWIKAIPSSKHENATIKDKGIKPIKKNTIPLVIILYVKPAKILNSIWPDNRDTNLSLLKYIIKATNLPV